MLDDRLTCSNCGTLFYYEEVRNIVKHRKKKCLYVVQIAMKLLSESCLMVILSATNYMKKVK